MKSRNKFGFVFMFGIVALVVAVSAGYTALTFQPIPEEDQKLPEIGEIPTGEYDDRTLEGKAYGANEEEPIKVEVVLSDGKIADIIIIDHAETPDISEPAFEHIPQAIIETQNIEVDTVSGATKTSEGIIRAVADAFGTE